MADIDAFLSAYAQAGAALVAIMGGFVLQRLLNEEAEQESIIRGLRRRRVVSEQLQARAAHMRWGWVEWQTYQLNRDAIVDYFRQNHQQTVEQAVPRMLHELSLFSDPEWVRQELGNCRTEALTPVQNQFHLPMPSILGADHRARVRAEEERMEALYAEAIGVTAENNVAIDEVDAFRAAVPTLRKSITFLLVAFLLTVVLPLAVIPWGDGLSLSADRVVAYYGSVRGVLMVIMVAVFIPGFVYARRKAMALTIPDSEVNAVTEFGSLTEFSDNFGHYDQNFVERT